jgi:hypothetical protein
VQVSTVTSAPRPRAAAWQGPLPLSDISPSFDSRTSPRFPSGPTAQDANSRRSDRWLVRRPDRRHPMRLAAARSVPVIDPDRSRQPLGHGADQRFRIAVRAPPKTPILSDHEDYKPSPRHAVPDVGRQQFREPLKGGVAGNGMTRTAALRHVRSLARGVASARSGRESEPDRENGIVLAPQRS